jgi:hypothetical protein
MGDTNSTVVIALVWLCLSCIVTDRDSGTFSAKYLFLHMISFWYKDVNDALLGGERGNQLLWLFADYLVFRCVLFEDKDTVHVQFVVDKVPPGQINMLVSVHLLKRYLEIWCCYNSSDWDTRDTSHPRTGCPEVFVCLSPSGDWPELFFHFRPYLFVMIILSSLLRRCVYPAANFKYAA